MPQLSAKPAKTQRDANLLIRKGMLVRIWKFVPLIMKKVNSYLSRGSNIQLWRARASKASAGSEGRCTLSPVPAAWSP